MLRISIEENVECWRSSSKGESLPCGRTRPRLGRNCTRLATGKLVLDLSSVTYADPSGTQVLGQIYKRHTRSLAERSGRNF